MRKSVIQTLWDSLSKGIQFKSVYGQLNVKRLLGDFYLKAYQNKIFGKISRCFSRKDVGSVDHPIPQRENIRDTYYKRSSSFIKDRLQDIQSKAGKPFLDMKLWKQKNERELAETKEKLQEAEKKIANQDRAKEKLRARSEVWYMADGENQDRRRREAKDRFQYRQALEWIANFVDTKLDDESTRTSVSEWRNERVNTIVKLRELKIKLDEVYATAKNLDGLGNTADTTGYLGVLILSLLDSQQLPAVPMFKIAGTLIKQVSSIIQSHFSEKYLNEIEAVLERDKALSRFLDTFLDSSRELDEEVEKIFGVSLASKQWNHVIEVFYLYSKISSSVICFEETISFLGQSGYSEDIGNTIGVDRLQNIFKEVHASTENAAWIRNTFSILSTSTSALQVFRDGSQAYRSIMNISSSSTTKETSNFCILKAMNPVLSYFELRKREKLEKYKYSDALEDLISRLQEELDEIDKYFPI